VKRTGEGPVGAVGTDPEGPGTDRTAVG
jgi:hypothetical protein